MSRNKYPEQTEGKIIDVATKLFLKKGYADTTILDIVDGMEGMTRGAFYHHFKSKKEVLDAIVARLNDVSNSWEPDLAGKNGLQKLRIILSLQKEFFISPYKEMITLIWSLTKNPEFLVEHIKINKMSADIIAPIVSEGIADGSIDKSVNPRLTAEFVTVIGNFWISPIYFPGTDEELFYKIKFFANVGKGIGCDVFDDKTCEVFFETAKSLKREVEKVLCNANNKEEE